MPIVEIIIEKETFLFEYDSLSTVHIVAEKIFVEWQAIHQCLSKRLKYVKDQQRRVLTGSFHIASLIESSPFELILEDFANTSDLVMRPDSVLASYRGVQRGLLKHIQNYLMNVHFVDISSEPDFQVYDVIDELMEVSDANVQEELFAALRCLVMKFSALAVGKYAVSRLVFMINSSKHREVVSKALTLLLNLFERNSSIWRTEMCFEELRFDELISRFMDDEEMTALISTVVSTVMPTPALLTSVSSKVLLPSISVPSILVPANSKQRLEAIPETALSSSNSSSRKYLKQSQSELLPDVAPLPPSTASSTHSHRSREHLLSRKSSAASVVASAEVISKQVSKESLLSKNLSKSSVLSRDPKSRCESPSGMSRAGDADFPRQASKQLLLESNEVGSSLPNLLSLLKSEKASVRKTALDLVCNRLRQHEEIHREDISIDRRISENAESALSFDELVSIVAPLLSCLKSFMDCRAASSRRKPAADSNFRGNASTSHWLIECALSSEQTDLVIVNSVFEGLQTILTLVMAGHDHDHVDDGMDSSTSLFRREVGCYPPELGAESHEYLRFLLSLANCENQQKAEIAAQLFVATLRSVGRGFLQMNPDHGPDFLNTFQYEAAGWEASGVHMELASLVYFTHSHLNLSNRQHLSLSYLNFICNFKPSKLSQLVTDDFSLLENLANLAFRCNSSLRRKSDVSFDIRASALECISRCSTLATTMSSLTKLKTCERTLQLIELICEETRVCRGNVPEANVVCLLGNAIKILANMSNQTTGVGATEALQLLGELRLVFAMQPNHEENISLMEENLMQFCMKNELLKFYLLLLQESPPLN